MVMRLLEDKATLVGEMNSMNEVVESLQKQVRKNDASKQEDEKNNSSSSRALLLSPLSLPSSINSLFILYTRPPPNDSFPCFHRPPHVCSFVLW